MPENKPEDSMSPPPVNLIQEEMISFSTINDANDVLAQIINLNVDGIMHEPTCIICKSPYRDEIEAKWIETKKHSDIKKILKEKAHLNVSDDVIDNHINFHYSKGIRELQKIEYISKLKRMSTVELTTLDRIKLGCSAIEERLAGINSIVPDNITSAIDVEEIKSSAVTKLMSTYTSLLKLKATIVGEMHDTGELIVVPAQDFITIFNNAIIDAKTDGEREVIKKLLGNLTELSKKTQ